MGRSLNEQGYGATRGELDDIAAQRVQQMREAELDTLQTGIGVVGIADPTGAADATNAGISLGRGDYLGFVLDGVSAVPYAGDVVGKPIRGVQMGIRSWARGRRVAAFARRGAALVERIRTMRVRAAEAVKRARRRNCTRCNNRYGSMTPTRGRWENPDNPGHGRYTVDGKDYYFKDGYPDLEHPEMQQYLHQGGPNRASIEMTGDRRTDDRLANYATGYDSKPPNTTWHHGDDGTTMYLMDRGAHRDIVPHDGGHSIAGDPLF